MRITTWNVNGLRKLTPLARTFDTLNSDIICIQETRVSSLDDPDLESLVFVPGYYSFFSVCRTRSGYSGVATYCRKSVATPVAATNSLNDDTGGASIPSNTECDLGSRCDCLGAGYDNLTLEAVRDEGRFVLTDHTHFVLINVYVPATSVPTRAAFKLSFLHALSAKITALNNCGRHVILVGDLNICPSRIDSAERARLPPDPEWDHRPGRMWLSRLVTPPHGPLIDGFRLSHPVQRDAFTCWSEAMQGRKTNYGVRIDLIFIHQRLVETSNPQTDIWTHVTGSDHCPVSLKMHSSCLLHPATNRPPPFCTQLLPRFTKRQQSITRYFSQSPQGKPPTSNCTRETPLTSVTASGSQSETHESQLVVSPKTFANSDPKTPALVPTTSGNKLIKEKLRLSNTITKAKSSCKRTRSSVSTSKRVVQTTLQFPRRPVNKVTTTSSQHENVNFNAEKLNTSNIDASDYENTTQSLPSPEQLSLAKENVRKQGETKWSKLLRGPRKPPLCRHGNSSVLKVVKKSGENKGRTFFSCRYPHGIGPHTNCNFFQWAPFDARFPTIPLPP